MVLEHTVRSADGFKFNLDVSQIIHIPRNDAPKVIARFGDMSALVTQVLEPTIGNYFRNAAQGSDIIDFLKNRSIRQTEARDSISIALQEYNVGAVDTLIGDIVPPDELMRTLTDRKIAEQERVTYETQRQAQTVKQELEQAAYDSHNLKGQLKQQLTAFVAIASKVNFNAPTVEKGKKTIFVNAADERQGALWKASFRAGEASTTAAIKLARAWLTEL